MSMGPGKPRKNPNHGNSEVRVTNHEYFGNVCSGFGGELVCEMLDPDTGEYCGLDPFQHEMNRKDSGLVF